MNRWMIAAVVLNSFTGGMSLVNGDYIWVLFFGIMVLLNLIALGDN